MSKIYDHLGRAMKAYTQIDGSLHSLDDTEEFHERPLLTDPETPFGIQPLGHAGFSDPIFSDECGGPLDRDKWDPWYPDTPFWNATVPGGHKTNSNEPQGYDETGITYDSGNMILRLREDNHAVPELDFTSGMVTSYPSFNPTYGYFETRMFLSDRNGAWPAFWMDRTDQTWPPEIDWMENWGRDSFNTTSFHTFHRPGLPYVQDTFSLPPGETNSFGQRWTVFGGLWEPGRLRWYVDGVKVFDFSHESVPSGPMYLICNLAGDKDQKPEVATHAPFEVRVDYIRAWALPEV